MSEFKASNMIMVGNLTSDLCLDNIAELLICTPTPMPFSVGDKHFGGSRIKIPYFGIDNIIISVRYQLKSRGVRLGGKQLPNTVSVDLQYSNKNIHLKISRKNIQLTGALNEKMGYNAFNCCLGHIIHVNNLAIRLKNLSVEVKENTINWVVSILTNPENEKLFLHTDPRIMELLESPPLEVDGEVAKYIAQFTHDCVNLENLNLKIGILTGLSLFKDSNNYNYEDIPEIRNTKICNGVYNYKVQKQFSQKDLCMYLVNLKYMARFTNFTKNKSVNVTIEISKSEEETHTGEVKRKKDKIVAHRFQIYKSGAIRQTSPTHIDVAKEIKDQLCFDLMNYTGPSSE